MLSTTLLEVKSLLDEAVFAAKAENATTSYSSQLSAPQQGAVAVAAAAAAGMGGGAGVSESAGVANGEFWRGLKARTEPHRRHYAVRHSVVNERYDNVLANKRKFRQRDIRLLKCPLCVAAGGAQNSMKFLCVGCMMPVCPKHMGDLHE